MKGERQKHGFKFEEWLKKTFLDIYYTSEWDIPQDLNPNKDGGPISIKTAQWQQSIGFGDALRQFDIDTDFTLIVGFWEATKGGKQIVKLTENLITKNDWRSYWGAISKDELMQLDKLIKDRKKDYHTVRQDAQAQKSKLKGKAGIITLNPKIDSKAQRRLQCSIPFKDFFEYIVKNPNPVQEKEFFLWGQKIKPPKL